MTTAWSPRAKRGTPAPEGYRGIQSEAPNYPRESAVFGMARSRQAIFTASNLGPALKCAVLMRDNARACIRGFGGGLNGRRSPIRAKPMYVEGDENQACAPRSTLEMCVTSAPRRGIRPLSTVAPARPRGASLAALTAACRCLA